MSTPLHDVGSVKISERDHSYLSARASQQNTTIVALIRDLVSKYVDSEIHVVIVADETHRAKELGTILGDSL